MDHSSTKTSFENQSSLPDVLRFLRSRKGMSARATSLACGLSPSYVSKVESGDMHVSLNAFAKIVKVLEVSAEEIVFIVRHLGGE